MQLSSEELQYIVNAINTHIRNNGLSAAAIGVEIVTKIQIEADEASKASSKSKKD